MRLIGRPPYCGAPKAQLGLSDYPPSRRASVGMILNARTVGTVQARAPIKTMTPIPTSDGGSDAFVELEEARKVSGFTYIWDQHYYNPITGDVVNYIHYKFRDGTQMNKAFRYEWRLWTLPELREVLTEAGFGTVTVYWEGTDEETGDGNDEFTATTKGDADPGWIAYLVAER